MNPLIDNYITTASTESVTENFVTHASYNYDSEPKFSWSFIIREPEEGGINKRITDALDKIECLDENWDNEGSIAPNKTMVQLARTISIFMEAMGQEIFNIVPGPYGEISIEFRNENKTLEILLYPNKMRYVMISDHEQPVQKDFVPDHTILANIITWLNQKN